MLDVIIIGCGVVGAATAFELSKYEIKCLVLEAENDLAMGTTKANSAIIHAGYDPEPETLMAHYNVRGNELTGQLCEKLEVPFERIGSLVLAFSEAQKGHIKEIYDRGLRNGVPNMRLLSADEVLEIEPAVTESVTGALLAETAAIIDPWDFTHALAETAVINGVEIRFNSAVEKIEKTETGFKVFTKKEVFETKYIFNAAGVYCDTVHELVGEKEFTVTPMRGQYYLLDKSQCVNARHILFQCPEKTTKGTLVAPTVHGNLIVGPNVESGYGLDDRGTTAEGLDFVRNMAMKTSEKINFRENIRNFSGIRAVTDIADFIIGESRTAKGFFNLAGIKSPGLSAAAAIGEDTAQMLKNAGLDLKKKENHICERTRIRFSELSDIERAELIKKDPRYGRVVCRCETVTEGEIIAALKSVIPPVSIGGVKRRCGAGMGRCQGGFCSPRVLEIIAAEMGISPLEVPEDGEGSLVLTGRTKEVNADV